MKRLIWAMPLVALLVACSKDAGEGGKAEIRGLVMEQRYNPNGLPAGVPYPLAEQNVYIVYGDATDGTYPDDNVDTGPDGKFRFPWLRKGTYTIYTMSECDTCASRARAVYSKVEIGDRKEVVDAGTLLVDNY